MSVAKKKVNEMCELIPVLSVDDKLKLADALEKATRPDDSEKS